MENQEQNPPQQEQPFVAAKQVSFNLEDILLNTNNEVSFFVPNGGIYGEVGVNTFRIAIGAHYLPHSREYVAPPSIDIVSPWFETIGYGETVPAKWTLKKSLFPPRVPQGTTPGAKLGHRKLLTSSKQPPVSSSEATKASTPVVAEMHNEDKQATGGLTSLGVTNKERVDPELSSGNDASAVSTAKVDPGKSAPSDFVLQQQGLETILTQPIPRKGTSSIARQVEEDEASRTIRLEDLAKLVSNVQPSFKDLDSPEDDPIIVVDDSDEDEEANKVHTTTNVETRDALVPKSSSLRSSQIQELTNHFNELTEEVKGLKKQVHNLKIELSGELKEIPTKLEDFTKTVTSLTSQVIELKTLQWELPAEFLSVPTQVEVIQAKLKILDALPSLLHKVTNALNHFAQAIASKKTKDNSVPSTGQASTQPAEGEKNTNQASIS
ncbi:hypothetical protein Tco_1246047 [Tanacetum coccineum]